VLGTRFRVQAEDDLPGKEVQRLLGSFEMPRPLPVRPRYTYNFVTAESAERPHNRLYRDCGGIGSGTWDQLALRLLTDLNRHAVDQYRGFAVHSGVVATNGSAIAFPADSKGGKSTLTSALVQEGLRYVSDESLCLDPETGLVDPYPKPITLSAESCRLLGIDTHHIDEDVVEQALTPQDLGGEPAEEPLELRHVVFAEYGHDGASLVPLPASETVAGLLRLSFNHYKNPADSFRIATETARGTVAWKLTYGDPKEAARLISSELG
jgi:hypothetical protein